MKKNKGINEERGSFLQAFCSTSVEDRYSFSSVKKIEAAERERVREGEKGEGGGRISIRSGPPVSGPSRPLSASLADQTITTNQCDSY